MQFSSTTKHSNKPERFMTDDLGGVVQVCYGKGGGGQSTTSSTSYVQSPEERALMQKLLPIVDTIFPGGKAATKLYDVPTLNMPQLAGLDVMNYVPTSKSGTPSTKGFSIPEGDTPISTYGGSPDSSASGTQYVPSVRDLPQTRENFNPYAYGSRYGIEWSKSVPEGTPQYINDPSGKGHYETRNTGAYDLGGIPYTADTFIPDQIANPAYSDKTWTDPWDYWTKYGKDAGNEFQYLPGLNPTPSPNPDPNPTPDPGNGKSLYENVYDSIAPSLWDTYNRNVENPLINRFAGSGSLGSPVGGLSGAAADALTASRNTAGNTIASSAYNLAQQPLLTGMQLQNARDLANLSGANSGALQEWQAKIQQSSYPYQILPGMLGGTLPTPVTTTQSSGGGKK